MAHRQDPSLESTWDPTQSYMQNLFSFLSLKDFGRLSQIEKRRRGDLATLVGGKIIDQLDRVQWILLSIPTQPDLTIVATSWNDIPGGGPHYVAEQDYSARQSSIKDVKAMKSIVSSLSLWIDKFERGVSDWNEIHWGTPFTELVKVIKEAMLKQKTSIEERKQDLENLDKARPPPQQDVLKVINDAKQAWKTLARIVGIIRDYIGKALIAL